MKKQAQKSISANRVVVTSFLVDVSDVVINLFVSVLTGSIVVRAEFLQGMADMIGSGFLIIGVNQSKKKADKLHPFGFGKEIYFWTLLSAIVMVVLAASFSLYFGFQRFLQPEPLVNMPIALAVLLIATCTNGYAVSLSYRRLMDTKPLSRFWSTLRHTTQVATKNALIQDTMGTMSAVTGLTALGLYVITGNAIFDGLGAMMIGVLLIILATFLITGLKDFVTGRSASDETIKQIRKAVLTIPEVQDILDLKTMVIGSNNVLVNIEVHLIDRLTTDQIEKLIDNIKKEVRINVPAVTHIQVELESPN